MTLAVPAGGGEGVGVEDQPNPDIEPLIIP